MTNKEETHKCKENINNDVEIRHEKINREQWSWVLEQTWYASPVEVEDEIAKREGEIISTHSIDFFLPILWIKVNRYPGEYLVNHNKSLKHGTPPVGGAP